MIRLTPQGIVLPEHLPPEDFVYVAGRYGDGDDFLRIQERINRGREHARQLARAGIPYYCPFLNSAHFDRIAPDVPREFWLRQNRAFLPRAWGMYVVEDEWTESAGVGSEIALMNRLGRPIYFTRQLAHLVKLWREQHGGQ